MAHNRVVNEGEISLGGRIYRINGPVQRSLASQFPPKMTLGDYTEESNPITSVITFSDQRAGIGKNVLRVGDDLTRAWFARSVNLQYENHLVLGPKVTKSDTGAGEPSLILGSSRNTLVVTESSGSGYYLYRYRPDTDSFNMLQAPNFTWPGTGTPTEFISGTLNDSFTTVICDGQRLLWTSSPNSSGSGVWESGTVAARYAAFWKNLLWVMTDSGATVFTGNLNTDSFTNVSQFPEPGTSVKKLFTGPLPTGDEGLYALSETGLWVYENTNERWIQTPLKFALANHLAAGVWRGNIYVSAELSMFEYAPGAQTVITAMGLDLDDGLPGEYVLDGDTPLTHFGNPNVGHVKAIVPTISHLYALVGFEGGGYAETSAREGVFRWNGNGWELVFDANQPGGISTPPDEARDMFPAASAHVDNFGNYRMFVAGHNDSAVHYFNLDGQVNPNIPSFVAAYASSGTWESPWLEKTGTQNFTAHQVIVNSDHPTSSETLAVKYALDYDDTSADAFRTIVTKNVSGEAKYLLPKEDDPEGIEFRAFKFKIDFARGESDSNTPDLKQVSLVFSKNLQPIWQFGVQIDMSESVGGYSPREMRQEIERIITGNRLTEFTYRNEDGGSETHFVKVLSPASTERTGHAEYTQYQLALVEPVPQAGT